MNILLINHEFPPIGGGGGVFTKLLARGLSKLNNNVFVLTISNKTFQKNISKNLKIIYIKLNRNNNANVTGIETLNFINQFRKIIKAIINKYNIDIINPHFIHTSGLSNYLSFNKVKTIISPLGADIYDPTRYKKIRKIMNFIAKQIFKKSNKIILSSKDMYDRTLKIDNSIKNKLKIIPHCINSRLYSNEKSYFLKQKYNLTNEKIILSVCRLVKRKNLDLSLNIISKLLKNNLNIKYFIVGDGPEKLHLKNQIKFMKLENKVFLLSNIDDKTLIKIYSDSDIFLLPSFHEAFGIAVLEAMASGTVPVCSDIGGWNDFIKNNETGFVCNNVKEYVERLKFLISSENEFKRISNNALTKAKTEYDYKIIAKKYYKVMINL